MDDQYVQEHSELEETKESIPTEPVLVTEFDPKRRELAIAYTRTARRYSIRLMIISFIISIGVLLSKATVLFRDLLNEYSIENPYIIVGIFFIVGFFIVNIAELPVSFYLHSRLSRRYGLSKLTNKRWLLRYVKGNIVGFLISFPLFEGFYWLLRTFPDIWWFWATLILILFTLIFSNLVPIIILPLFFKFDPLEDTHPELSAELVEMTQHIGIKITRAFIWRIGEIATTSNAALLGLGNTRRIIIADTMLDKYTTNEIKWILAHEIGHYKHHDFWKKIAIISFTTFLIFLLTHLMFTPLATVFGYSSVIGDVSGIPVIGLCFWVLSFIIDIPSLWYSRKQEAATDDFASSIIMDPFVAKSLFIKMADQNLSDIDPPWWEKLFFMSHPSISERIREVEKNIEHSDT
ncbi:MAG: M48 family metallopeptidase [Candidatus Heimdallarchaeota archaeon]|nr:MAG: M48 family metallopeptidase [Candidatus Heimdallarchaeota archaeon]